MSTELAQDEDDAEGRDAEAYDLEAMARGPYAQPADQEGGIRLNGDERHALRGDDDVVFEIGDEDEEGEHTPTATATPGRRTEPSALGGGGYEITDDGDANERGGLMGGSRTDKRLD